MKRFSSSDYAWGDADPQQNSSEDSILNRFTDENICGESASCIVYLMRLRGLRVAVKRLKAEHRTDPRYVGSYRKEYQLGRQLKHDALPVYWDMHEDVNEVYIVMDFIDGVSLEDFLDSDAGQEYFGNAANVKRFIAQLLDVVTYLHRSGVIHCDIKPANIMLRHSDRGVMLLDLDKSYSDTLDLNHGGTALMSDPLAEGETPTAAKDFQAIGNLIDYIAERVPKFPGIRFRRFRDTCRSKDATDERLAQALQHRSKAYLWAIGFVLLCVVFGVYYLIQSYERTKPMETPRQALPENKIDTIKVIEKDPAEHTVTPAQSQPQLKISTADFDSRISAFIREAEVAMASLRKGNATDKEIRRMSSGLLESYTSKYQSLLSAYKSENPDVSGIDVELAVAGASERSKATALWQQFTQSATDTLKQRHPNSYSDD